jgi:methionyl-tRNA formyltransferase
MKIVVACAAKRGLLFLEKLFSLEPAADYEIFSFREEAVEPPFMDEIRDCAHAHGASFHEAKQLGMQKLTSFWQNEKIDLMLVVGWRYMIPRAVFSKSRLGTYVFHDSPLPEYRGFAPSVWAIVNGEDHTGVTLFSITDEVDAGDIIDQQLIPITRTETITDLVPRVTKTYLDILEKNLPRLLKGDPKGSPQDNSKATFTCKRTLLDNRIKWSDPSQKIFNLIRGVTHPYPGAYSFLNNKKITVWSAELITNLRNYIGRIPGRIVEIKKNLGALILTGDGSILVKTIQLEGEQEICAAESLNSISMTLE